MNFFELFYDIAPHQSVYGGSQGYVLPVPWSNQQQLRATIQAGSTEAPPLTGLIRRISACEGFVRKNFRDLAAFRLQPSTLSIYSGGIPSWSWKPKTRCGQLSPARRLSRPLPNGPAVAASARNRLGHWEAERFSNQVRAYNVNPPDQLLFRFREAASYSMQLARNPEVFSHLLAKLS
jgi:hypothetical protein